MLQTTLYSTDICNLSVTYRRLRWVAQEALVRTATILTKNAWKLIETLHDRPELVRWLSNFRLAGEYVIYSFLFVHGSAVGVQSHVCSGL